MSHKRQRDRVAKTFSLPDQALLPRLLQGKPYFLRMKDCPELETIFLSKQRGCDTGIYLLYLLN
jgi:hypothetical protein